MNLILTLTYQLTIFTGEKTLWNGNLEKSYSVDDYNKIVLTTTSSPTLEDFGRPEISVFRLLLILLSFGSLSRDVTLLESLDQLGINLNVSTTIILLQNLA